MKRIYLYTLSIRIWHWTNAAIIILLSITGLQLRISDGDIFAGFGFVVVFHKYLGYALTLSFFFWFFYYLCTGGLAKHYLLKPRDIKGMVKQALYYLLGIFRGNPNPFRPSPDNKFNPLQKMAYFSVMVLFTPIVIITGILFSDIVYFLPAINYIGGLHFLDALHVVTGYVFVLYLMVHIYMATLGPTIFTHTKSMITGYEEEEEEP